MRKIQTMLLTTPFSLTFAVFPANHFRLWMVPVQLGYAELHHTASHGPRGSRRRQAPRGAIHHDLQAVQQLARGLH